MALAESDLFSNVGEYWDGAHYVKPCMLCGAVVPVWSELPTPTGFRKGSEIHVMFHNRIEALL